MQKWEYEERRFRLDDGNTDRLIEQLNLMGNAGWELVSLTPMYKYSQYDDIAGQIVGVHPLEHDGFMLGIFKRSKENG